MVSCPYCGFEGRLRLIKTWRYRFYDVRMISCPNCRGVFNYYSGVSPTGKKSEFVVGLKPRVRAPASTGGTRRARRGLLGPPAGYRLHC